MPCRNTVTTIRQDGEDMATLRATVKNAMGFFLNFFFFLRAETPFLDPIKMSLKVKMELCRCLRPDTLFT